MFILNTAVLFFAGFYLLVKGSGVLVRGAISIAKLLGVSQWVVGMVIVGIGTSLPEFAVMLASAVEGNAVGLGAIIGSNTFNLLFVLGLAALCAPIAMQHEWVFRDIPINMGAIVLTAVLLFLPVFGEAEYAITRGESLLLILCFALWMWFMFSRSALEDEAEEQIYTALASCIMIIGGIAGVIFGGMWVVDGAVVFANILGASESLIGLTIVGIGTSLPELSVTLSAALKGKAGLAAGSIIGSNIFNFFGIIAFTSLLIPIAPEDPGIVFDFAITFVATLAIYAALIMGRGLSLSRAEGVLLMLCYVAYLSVLIMRG